MELKVNLSTGETLGYELPSHLSSWISKQSDPHFQRQIRGLGLVRDGQYFALSAPSAFKSVVYMAESNAKENGAPAAVTVGYVADDVMVRLTVYYNEHSMSRLDVRKVGKPRWLSSNKGRENGIRNNS